MSDLGLLYDEPRKGLVNKVPQTEREILEHNLWTRVANAVHPINHRLYQAIVDERGNITSNPSDKINADGTKSFLFTFVSGSDNWRFTFEGNDEKEADGSPVHYNARIQFDASGKLNPEDEIIDDTLLISCTPYLRTEQIEIASLE